MTFSARARAVVAGGFIALAGAFTGSSKPEFDLVVHPSNPVNDLSRSQIAQIFLKKMTRWPTGRGVLVVDQPADARIRQRFTTVILEKEMRQVDAYWQESIFSGRAVPPLQRRSDAEVIAYVRENPDAIGYVTAGAAGVTDVKIVDVQP